MNKIFTKTLLRIAFVILGLVSYTVANAQCTTGSATGTGLGTNSVAVTPNCTYQNILSGTGEDVTLTGLTSTFYYDFQYLSGGQNPSGTIGMGTSITGITSRTIGVGRNPAIACGSWSGTSATLQYRLSAPGTPTVGAGTNICGLTSGSLGGSTPVNGIGTWTKATGPGTASFSNANSASSTVTVSAYGAYTFTWTVNNGGVGGCNASATSTTYNFYQSPTISTAPTTVCDNSTAGFGANISVTWSTSGGSVVAGPSTTTTFTPPNVSVPTQNQNVTITATNGTCVQTAVIRVDNLPTITNPTAVCDNSSATVTQDITGGVITVSAGSWASNTFTPPNVSVPTQNQNVTITATNGACAPTSTIRVDNNTTAAAGSPQAQCNNGNFTLAGNDPSLTVTGSTGTWTCQANCTGISYVSASAFNSSMGSVPPNTTTTSRWTVVNGTCSNFSDVTTRNDGVPSVSGPSTVCDVDGTVSYTQTGGSSIVWSYTGSGAAINPTTGDLSISNIATPTQSISGTVTATGGSCATNKAVTIYNKTSFTNSFASLCETQSVTLTADVTGTTFSGTGVSAGVFTAPTIGGTSQSFILTATNGPTSCQDQQIITVYKVSSISSSSADMCQGNTRTLTATPGPGAFSSVACPSCVVGTTFTAPIPSGNSQVIDIVYTVSGAPCSATQNITVYHTPSTASVGSTQTVCGLTSTSLGGNTPTYGTGAWTQVSGPGTTTFSASGSGSSTATASAYGSYTYRWTISNGACTNSTADIIVNYDEAPTTASVGATQNLCGTLTSTSLGGNTPTVGTGAWSQVSGPGTSTFSAGTSGSSTATASAYGTYVYRWTITNGVVCTPSTANITVNYYQTPTTASVGSTQNHCGTLTSTSLGGNTPTVGTGAWSQVSGPGTSTYSAGTSGSSTATASAYGTYVYRWTISNGTCTPSTADITVNYYQTPTTASVGSNQIICGSLTSTSLGGNTPTVGTGAWSQVSGPGSSTFSAGTSGSSTATASTIGSYVYRWTISNGTCTPSTADVTVVFGSSVSAPTSGGDQEACYRTTVPNLTVTVGAGETADWYDAASGGTLVKTGSLTFNEATDGSGPNPTPGSYTYYAEGRNTTSGCVSTTRTAVTLTIRAVPVISPTATPNTACAGDNVLLDANATAGSGTITSYAWSSGLGAVASGTVNPTSTTTYTVTVTNSYSCTNDASTSVTIKTGAAYVVLPASTVTTLVEQCTDGGWTYYANASTPDDWTFAIKKNGNTFTAQVDITVAGSTIDHINTTKAGYEHGSYLMKRYWDVTVMSGSISTSVDVKFFYDPAEKSAALSARDAAWTPYSATASKTAFRWFKTVGSSFGSVISSIDGNSFNNFSNITLTEAASGTENGVTYAEFDGITSFSGGTGGYGFSSPGTGLPVKLIDFTATSVENSFIRLDWSTALELNNAGFEIERSTNGTEFTKIGWVQGHDNSTVRQVYVYDDKTAQPNIRYYYRLKQIDNGNVAFEYSKIVTATIVNEGKTAVGDFIPNPAKDKATIDLFIGKDQAVVIDVYEVTGKFIKSEKLDMKKGFNTYFIQTEDLSAATYVVSFKMDDQRISKRLNVLK